MRRLSVVNAAALPANVAPDCRECRGGGVRSGHGEAKARRAARTSVFNCRRLLPL